MKVCNTEAMKLIKEYEEQKRMMIVAEDDDCAASYKEGEKKIDNGYSYDKVRAAVREIDDKIRHIRSKLAQSNCTTQVEGFGVTLGEALVMLAQLQSERQQIESLAARKQLTRRLTVNGVLEYTECLYDIEKAKADAQALRKKISALQIAIDRANLNAFIEI